MRAYIEERVIEIAEYVIETGATVRQAANIFCTSKSTVHKDLTERLKEVSPAAAREVAEVLFKNKSERHIRGGRATKEKYAKK